MGTKKNVVCCFEQILGEATYTSISQIRQARHVELYRWKYGRNNLRRSYVDYYIWTHQRYLTTKNMHTLSMNEHFVPSGELSAITDRNGWRKERKRESSESVLLKRLDIEHGDGGYCTNNHPLRRENWTLYFFEFSSKNFSVSENATDIIALVILPGHLFQDLDSVTVPWSFGKLEAMQN